MLYFFKYSILIIYGFFSFSFFYKVIEVKVFLRNASCLQNANVRLY